MVTRIESKELVMMAVNAKTGAICQLFREATRTFFDPSVTARTFTVNRGSLEFFEDPRKAVRE